MLLIQPDQRGFQQRGQRQIIIGQQQTFRERQHILHRQLISQNHAINAANRDQKVLQFPHQRRRKAATLSRPQQHQNITRANRAARGLRCFLALFHARRQGFVLDHLHDAPRDGSSQARCGAFRIHGLFRRRPIGRRLRLIHLQDRPKLHAAGMAGTVRIMLQFRIG